MTTESLPLTISNVECLDLAKSSKPISSGIGYFDHMLDQFNSHAQVGVAVTVSTESMDMDVDNDKNRFASQDQASLMNRVGTELGAEMKKLLLHKKIPIGASSRFCCPLDEALVECVLTCAINEGGRLSTFTLPPYGIYPRDKGRSKIGQMECKNLHGFFEQLAQQSGLDVQLIKIRGDNGHHVCESAFKAFSRALRNLLDGTNTTKTNGAATRTESLWGSTSESNQKGIALERKGSVERTTKETSISVSLKLDGGKDGVSVDTGIATLDDFFTALAQEARASLNIKCKGDLWVDDHHTSEDVAIALGQVLNKAFGTKAGLNRMWCAVGKCGDAEVEVTMDLSNRPCLTHNLTLANSDEEYVGDALSVEMMDHVLESLVMNGLMTVHIVELKAGKTVKETAMATAAAFGRALYFCSAVDPRRAGKTASSKGTLSV